MLNFGNKEFRNLQEQVLKNAQDIETLKGRENLQIVIVEELPEEGNPNYIYLVPNNDEEEENVYDEYIWLADSEEYEKIGGVDIDLTNYVTLDSAQTISGEKTFSSKIYLPSNISLPDAGATISCGNSDEITITKAEVKFDGKVRPWSGNAFDLGDSVYTWKDLYLSGSILFSTTEYIQRSATKAINVFINNNKKFSIEEWVIYTWIALRPANNNVVSLGSPTECWKDLYVAGNFSDGVNTVSVANIASKVTSTFISGTFDSNGESTIDTEQAGTPEGLFIFTYGNCQCFLRLNATMINSADTAPIRVACPMIYNSGTVNGWLNITKSGAILILTITDGTNHVDSGYAWTLTKTNLI